MQDTKRPLSQQRGVTRWKAWKAFQHDVGMLESWSDAWGLSSRGPECGSPGSSFYTNLAFFLRHRSVPLGADEAQRALYESLVARLGALPVMAPPTARAV